jgi:spore maturation protein CgeB
MIIKKETIYCDRCKKEIDKSHGSLKLSLDIEDYSGHFVGGKNIIFKHLCRNCAWSIEKYINTEPGKDI